MSGGCQRGHQSVGALRRNYRAGIATYLELGTCCIFGYCNYSDERMCVSNGVVAFYARCVAFLRSITNSPQPRMIEYIRGGKRIIKQMAVTKMLLPASTQMNKNR